MPSSPGQRAPLSRHLRGADGTRPSLIPKAVKPNLFLSAPRRRYGRGSGNGVNLISCRSVMDGVIDVLVRHGYLVVFGWVLADQIGLPLPAVPFLLAAGALAGNGRLSVALILAAAALASLASDTAWYWIGRVGGGRVLRWLC